MASRSATTRTWQVSRSRVRFTRKVYSNPGVDHMNTGIWYMAPNLWFICFLRWGSFKFTVGLAKIHLCLSGRLSRKALPHGLCGMHRHIHSAPFLSSWPKPFCGSLVVLNSPMLQIEGRGKTAKTRPKLR